MAINYQSYKKITSVGIVDQSLEGKSFNIGQVTSRKISNQNLTDLAFADGAITSDKYLDQSILTESFADDAVVLNTNAVTNVLPYSHGGTGLSSSTVGRTLKVNTAGNGLTWDYAGLVSIQVYRSNATWTKPAGVRYVHVQLVGGGAGGSGHGEAGGAGGFAEEIIDVRTISSVSITVGGNGGGNTYHNYGGNGGTTSFGPYLSASGGEGARRVGGHSGGRPGAGSGGNLNIYGGGGAGHTHYGGGQGGHSYFGGANLAAHSNVDHRSWEGRAAPGTGGCGAPVARRRGSSGNTGMVVVYNIK